VLIEWYYFETGIDQGHDFLQTSVIASELEIREPNPSLSSSSLASAERQVTITSGEMYPEFGIV
jgi:hypothetical protein